MTNDVQWKPESVDDEENRHLLSYAKAVREFAESISQRIESKSIHAVDLNSLLPLDII